ncbi:MAG: cation:proton antiporter, partial [Candidatus Tectomicrobia bacterium]|nr:cation:proton antiporter [Candidatus Tectomicrobia bacterium]
PENIPILTIALVITIIAVIGKVVSGYAVPRRQANRLAIGVGMMPRGEVGLIFAQFGRATGLFSYEIFSALVVVVMVTTFLAPPLLKVALRQGD